MTQYLNVKIQSENYPLSLVLEPPSIIIFLLWPRKIQNVTITTLYFIYILLKVFFHITWLQFSLISFESTIFVSSTFI